MRRALPVLHALWLLCAACGAQQGTPTPASPAPPAVFADRYLWVSTACADGELPIGTSGFTQSLTIEPRAHALQLEFDTAIVSRACADLSVWEAVPAFGEPLDMDLTLTPRASVQLPPDSRCGPTQLQPTRGKLRASGEELTLVLRAAAWCRGLQASLRYRRVGAHAHAHAHAQDDIVLIRRYLARFAAGDAAGAAALFSREGALVEPFSPSADGLPTRHRGRAAVDAWLRGALATRPWLAVRALDIEPLPEPGHYAARYEYMDPDLQSPLTARNLFVIADGEVFEAQLQLLSVPRPRVFAPDAGTTPNPDAGTAPNPDAGAAPNPDAGTAPVGADASGT